MSSRADGRAGSPFRLRGCRARTSTCRPSRPRGGRPDRPARSVAALRRREVPARLRAGGVCGSGAPGRRNAASRRCAMLASAASGGPPGSAAGTIGGGSTGRGAIPGGKGARISGSAKGRGSGRAARAAGSGRPNAGRVGSGGGVHAASSSNGCGRFVSGVRAPSARGTGTSRGGLTGTARTMFCSTTKSLGPPMQQQMLDIVAPHQHEAAASVDRRGVDHGKPRLTAALRGGADARGAEAANEPEGQSDEGEYDHERNDEAHDQRPLRAKQAIHLRSPLHRLRHHPAEADTGHDGSPTPKTITNCKRKRPFRPRGMRNQRFLG